MKKERIIVNSATLADMQYRSFHTYIAYKIIRKDGRPAFQTGHKIRYKVGGTYRVRTGNHNPRVSCGAGLHLGTKDWCINHRSNFNGVEEILVQCEFDGRDILAVPYSIQCEHTNRIMTIQFAGKFRVKKFKIIKKVRW